MFFMLVVAIIPQLKKYPNHKTVATNGTMVEQCTILS